jgi:hypothetical protein
MEVLILKDLWSDKTRQNAVKRGVLANVGNKGVTEFQLVENKKASWKLAVRNGRRIVT